MFYSHEILTSSKHGVATIWLIATLGSKSSLRKITRKAILDVDVPKACDTIIDPSAPMALRLQGNLLYGVSRVYSQQCGYVLTDIQAFRDKMRRATEAMRDKELDPEAGRARADQLNIPDDPAFIPAFDMDLDMSLFGLSADSSSVSGSLSPLTLASSQSSNPIGEHEEPIIVFPSSDSPGGGYGTYASRDELSSIPRTAVRSNLASVFEGESAINENPGFEFDADGVMREFQQGTESKGETLIRQTRSPGTRPESDSGISARVRAEHEGEFAGDEADLGIDFDEYLPAVGDDDIALPPALPFSLYRNSEPENHSPHNAARQASSAHPSSESSVSAEAPQRWARPPKQLPVDQQTELTNKQLSEWNVSYIKNMTASSRHKEQNKSIAQAKKNAAFWVLAQGIGGVNVEFGQDIVPHPLAEFSGQRLLNGLTGRDDTPETGRKRSRNTTDASDIEEEEDENGRRVRPREEDSEQVGMGDDDMMILGDDDDGQVFGGDLPGSEVGRHAPSSLPDRSSRMPWNRSASGLPYTRASSSVGGAGFELEPLLSRAGWRGRLPSASPLFGKGRHLGRLSRVTSAEISSPPMPAENDPGLDVFDDDVMMPPGSSHDESDEAFELYGPAAAVSTQTAAQSQWVAATLEHEAQNFMMFFQKEAKERGRLKPMDDAEGGEVEDSQKGDAARAINLDQLLPPSQNSSIVAAQALLHVLALATKGLIGVNQIHAFGDIELSVTGHEPAFEGIGDK